MSSQIIRDLATAIVDGLLETARGQGDRLAVKKWAGARRGFETDLGGRDRHSAIRCVEATLRGSIVDQMAQLIDELREAGDA